MSPSTDPNEAAAPAMADDDEVLVLEVLEADGRRTPVVCLPIR